MIDAVVIGAGPYGLSVAGQLLNAGLSVRVFGQVMAMWRNHMPKGMLLKSDGFATNLGGLPLTLAKFCEQTGRRYGDVGHRTPIGDLIAYGEQVQRQYVGAVEDIHVDRVRKVVDGFRVDLANGETVHAARVVAATGLIGLERMPEIAGMPEGVLSHASAHADLGRFAGQRVLVIGAGQSAFESAALLHESGADVKLITRRKPFWFKPEGESVPSAWTRIRHPNFGLGPGYRAWLWSEAPRLFSYLPVKTRLANAYSTFGPAGSGWLYHRVVGKIDIATGIISHAQKSADGTHVIATSADGKRLDYPLDHVIAATGYQPDIRRLGFLAPVIDQIACLADGLPALDHSYQTSVRGLYVVGCLSAPSMGPSMRFIYGTNFTAPQLARLVRRDMGKTITGFRNKTDRFTSTPQLVKN